MSNPPGLSSTGPGWPGTAANGASKPGPRGLTMMDIAVGYVLNDKSDVWSANVSTLYEEAVARQWSATRDIPWNELEELAPEIEHAMCQLCTTLSEIEMIASDLPAKWMWRMNHEFLEAKMFLCTQIMDEARHCEVFRKRALVNEGGLLESRGGTETFCARSSKQRPTPRPPLCSTFLARG